MNRLQGFGMKGTRAMEKWLATVVTAVLASCAAPDGQGEEKKPDDAPAVGVMSQNAIQVDGAYVDWVWGSALPGWTQNIEDKMFQLIDNTEALSSDATNKKIHITMLHWNGTTGALGAEKLKNAKARGVWVGANIDAKDTATTLNSTNTSELKRCRWTGTTDDATHTSCFNRNRVGQMHAKTLTFTRTKQLSDLQTARDYVSVVSSHNMGMGPVWENNAVVIYNHKALYDRLVKFYDDAKVANANPAGGEGQGGMGPDYGATSWSSGSFGLYFSPWRGSLDGNDATTDWVAMHLGEMKGGVTPGDCELDIVQANFSKAGRPAIWNALVKIATPVADGGYGCTVRLSYGNTGIRPGQAGTISGLLYLGNPKVAIMNHDCASWGVHSKYYAWRGKWGTGTTEKKIVFTGSHNWLPGERFDTDEVILKVENASMYDSFRANSMRIMRDDIVTGCDQKVTHDGAETYSVMEPACALKPGQTAADRGAACCGPSGCIPGPNY
jgi:hypothetical protein